MSERSTEVSAFYAREADRLLAAVRMRTRAVTEEVVEDACQHAWLALVRRQDISLDSRGAQWLVTVATHEAWRLGAAARYSIRVVSRPGRRQRRASGTGIS